MKVKAVFFRLASLLLVFACFYLSSCKKEQFAPAGTSISFSTDTLSFDTVFVTLGSTTEFLAIRNTLKSKVFIDQIYLEGGEQSAYRINVDGLSGDAKDIEIPAGDSILVFVEVTVDPNESNLPFLIEDALVVQSAGTVQKVVLESYGQNAHFFNAEELETQNWTDDLPYVILNSVLVKEGHTLTIEEGCDIYFGGSSALYVEGSLNIIGTKDSIVTLRGVRLDNLISGTSYDEIPGQWTGVFLLRGSANNTISFAEIRNSQFGISLGSTSIDELPNISIDNGPDVKLNNVEIHNVSVFGLFGLLSKIEAENLLVYDCGSNMLAFQMGGSYEFQHCTFYNRGNAFVPHQESMLYGSNYFYDEGIPIFGESDLNLRFTNSIIYGSEREEIVLDTVPSSLSQGEVVFDARFNSCLIKTEHTNDTIFTKNILNADPAFVDLTERDFHLSDQSPALDEAQSSTVLLDFECKPRVGMPDIGCYEFSE